MTIYPTLLLLLLLMESTRNEEGEKKRIGRECCRDDIASTVPLENSTLPRMVESISHYREK